MTNLNKRVLIAGAGPVGLVAANVLADAGIPVSVFEAEAALPQTLRASTFQPSTLDLLSRFGVSQRLIEMGLVAPRMQYRDRKGWMAEFDFGVLSDVTQHPYRVQCEQFRLNGLLADRLASFPHADITFGARIAGVSQDADQVTVALTGEQGDTSATGAWLIGADGGRSKVRDEIGVSLGGFTWPERFLVASTPFDFPAVIPDLCEVSYFADPEQWFFLLRVSGLWRVMMPIGAEDSDADVLSDAYIQQRLHRVHDKAGDFEIIHRTIYAVHQRVANSYRNGRVFLAGDAAHLNNPLGGMGMNGGVHDAFTLADQLVAVLQGAADEATLDTYEQRRRPVALDYVNTITIANKRNLETRDANEQRKWREEMTRISGDKRLAREYLLKVSMISSLRGATIAA
ncbi:FAD-dependent oxidoreductase [Pigmentiphaga litoralis]|uniref:3-(3-hydroxy-phenyl)propionate hydroxylase n=1 Tax=Pigmentiphaga litoralis TaxID=516702 RepID=A0A7Y9J0D4_9BURK|nr:FAD-dependent monooxygenase [Pigmentiphaga litoralis]NYE26264.1 3-(3-hydroxy-phenyl)propionate hydroxylase [Pigmentiphaga litoralis]NYE85384.1 3-(3-hydroxy-phenyl)propionate hydroxylase [Pigmentiphaga litoralis]